MSNDTGRQQWLRGFARAAPGTELRRAQDAKSAAILDNPKLAGQVQEKLRKYVSTVIAQQEGGAGLLADQQLRYFQRDYHHRLMQHGSGYLPTNYRIAEAFFESRPEAPGFYLLPERDFQASVADFLDCITGPNAPQARLEQGYGFIDGQIYNLSSTDLPDSLLLETRADSAYSVRAGSLVRRGDELVVMLALGEQLSSERLEELKATARQAQDPVAWKRELAQKMADAQVLPELVPGTSLLACTSMVRFNLRERRMEARCLLRDMGDMFRTWTDQVEALGGQVGEDDQAFQDMVRHLDDCDAIWEISKTLTLFPAYLAARLPWTQDSRSATSLGKSMTKSLKTQRQLKEVGTSDKVLFRVIRAVGAPPREARPLLVGRHYVAPAFQVAVEGFWRRLPGPAQQGRGPDGSPEQGRTWVRSHLRHKDKAPAAGPKIVYIKESLSEARRRLEEFRRRQNASPAGARPLDMELPASSPTPAQRELPREGAFVYVMRCHAHTENLFKVGFTDRDPETRARELSSATAAPLPFQVMRAWAVSDGFAAEQSAHRALGEMRLSESREFFQLLYDELCTKVQQAVGPWLL